MSKNILLDNLKNLPFTLRLQLNLWVAANVFFLGGKSIKSDPCEYAVIPLYIKSAAYCSFRCFPACRLFSSSVQLIRARQLLTVAGSTAAMWLIALLFTSTSSVSTYNSNTSKSQHRVLAWLPLTQQNRETNSPCQRKTLDFFFFFNRNEPNEVLTIQHNQVDCYSNIHPSGGNDSSAVHQGERVLLQ